MAAEDEQKKIYDQFDENLKAKDYLEMISGGYTQEDPDLFRFMMMTLHDVFRSERFEGSKLCDLGSAATVHNVAAASAYFSKITLTDYVKDNVEALKKWVAGDPDLIQLVDCQVGLEGYGCNMSRGREIVESRIRERVKRVSRCDVNTEKIFMDDIDDPDVSPPFDVIVSGLCLETAPPDFDGYKRNMKYVSNLLRKGGGIVLAGFLEATPWVVSGQSFHQLKEIGENQLLEALEEAGFGKVDMKTKEFTTKLEGGNFTFSKCFVVAAEKL